MLPDNYRALSLTKKMGFSLEYLSDDTVKGVLDLKEEILEDRCPRTKLEHEEFSDMEKPEVPAAKGNAEPKQETEAAARA
jgi:hypothetical protein